MVQFLDKVVDMPVVVQRVDQVVDVLVVQVPQFIDGENAATCCLWNSGEVPQIQFIARVCRHSSSQQRRVPTVQIVQPSGGLVAVKGVLAVFQHFSRSSGLSRT